MNGKINSFQSFGATDGPGVRAVVFMQGCPLRCKCCHNPETWSFDDGEEISTDTLFDKVMRCRTYFGKDGGVTASGGEPLMQARFLTGLFKKLKNAGISTALDTSGCILNGDVKELLDVTDTVILDYKYTNADDYFKNTGCKKEAVDEFLNYLETAEKSVWIRQVIIGGLNDSPESVKKLAALREKYRCIEKIELLPFRKMCSEKYDALKIPFPLKNIPETSRNKTEELKKLL